MATILITGGSGLIGGALTHALLKQGHVVRHLGRRSGDRRNVRTFTWNVARAEVEEEALHGVDHIVHLAGAGIADKRWTARRVHELIESRAASALLLLRTAKRLGVVPRSFVSAAGINYYGAVTTDRMFTEQDLPGNDTIGRISQEWEAGVDAWNTVCRVVKLRTPVVLSPSGGALEKLALPVRFGLGAALGGGYQWMPWVHVDDLVSIYIKALNDERMHGAYNVNAGNVTNEEFMRTLAHVLGRPYFLPRVPAFLLRMALGDLASVLLAGSRASNERLLAAGFHFGYVELEPALRALLNRPQ